MSCLYLPHWPFTTLQTPLGIGPFSKQLLPQVRTKLLQGPPRLLSTLTELPNPNRTQKAAGSELLLDVYAADKPLDNGTSPAIIMFLGSYCLGIP